MCFKISARNLPKLAIASIVKGMPTTPYAITKSRPSVVFGATLPYPENLKQKVLHGEHAENL